MTWFDSPALNMIPWACHAWSLREALGIRPEHCWVWLPNKIKQTIHKDVHYMLQKKNQGVLHYSYLMWQIRVFSLTLLEVIASPYFWLLTNTYSMWKQTKKVKAILNRQQAIVSCYTECHHKWQLYLQTTACIYYLSNTEINFFYAFSVCFHKLIHHAVMFIWVMNHCNMYLNSGLAG